jgi:hypothetical protein
MLLQRVLRCPTISVHCDLPVIVESHARVVHRACLLTRAEVSVVSPQCGSQDRGSADFDGVAIQQMNVGCLRRLGAAFRQFIAKIAAVVLVVACHIDDRFAIQLMRRDELHAGDQSVTDIAGYNQHVVLRPRVGQEQGIPLIDVDMQVRQDPKLRHLRSAA